MAAAVAVVLSGPTEIGILRGRVEQTVARALGPGFDVSVGRTTVDVDPALGLVVLVDDVSVRDSTSTVVASIPSTRLAVDPIALLTFRGLIRSVELDSPEISFVREADGRVRLGRAAAPSRPDPGAAPAIAPGGFPDLLAALQILDHGIEPSIQAALHTGFLRFAMVQATIDIADATHSEQRRLPRTDLSVSVTPVTGEVSVNLVSSGYSGRWSATAERVVDPATGQRQLTARFSQLTLADLFPHFARDDSPISSDIPLYGRATVTLGADGTVREAGMRLDLGAGTVEFRGGRETMQLDEATIRLRWDVANQALLIDPSPYSFGEGRGTIIGVIRPIGDVAERKYAFAIESRGAVLAARDANAPALPLQRMAVTGTADLPKKLISFENASMVAEKGSVTGAGSIDFNGISPSVAMAATISPMPVEVIKQFWPPFIAGGARKWVLEHVSAGRVASGHMDAAIPAGVIWTGERKPIPDDALRLSFRLEDVSFTTLGDVPAVVHAYGNAALAGSTFGIDIERGKVVTPRGRTVEVNAGAFAVSNLVPIFPDAQVELQMAGDVAGLAEIADSHPFNALKRQNISPAALTGSGTANLSARWPLRPNLADADVEWRVDVAVSDFASADPIIGRRISDGKATITVTPDDVSIMGRGRIDGVVADINLVQPIREDRAAGPGKRSLRLTLDEQARRKLGLGVEDVVGGTIDAVVSDRPKGGGQHYEIDLKRARLTLAALGWSKGVGVPARLTFDLIEAKDGYSVENVELTGSGFGLTGKIFLDAKYNLVSADISNVTLHKGDDASFTVRRDKGAYVVSAAGKSFDIRGLIERFRNPPSTSAETPDLILEAKVDRLVGFDNEVLGKAELAMNAIGGSLQRLELKGQLGKSTVVASYVEKAESAKLSLTSDDAGAVFRFISLYGKIAGGALRLRGERVGANAPMLGAFDVSNFFVVGEPVMARVANSSDRSQGFDPNAVPFQRMQLSFTLRNSTIVIDDALLRSADIGATFDGKIDLAQSYILLQGTYLPAYAINNMFGKIPVLGLALGGGSKGGLLGLTFQVEGKLDNPAVHINALSAIAPGITRKFFEFRTYQPPG